MKVFITNMRESTYNSATIPVGAAFYDETENVFVEQLLYDMPATSALSTPQMMATVNAYILWYSGTRGFTVVENDIRWYGVSVFSEYDRSGLDGVWSPSINGNNVGNTTVFTNNSLQDYMLTDAFIQLEAVSGLGTQPIINIGRISSGFNDIVNALNLNILSSADTYSKVNPRNGAVLVPPGQSVVVRVSVAAILTTTFNFKVMVRGVYLS